MNQLPVPKEIRKFADFERELKRDPRLKWDHTIRGCQRALFALEEWRTGRQITKPLVVVYTSKPQAQCKLPKPINRNLAVVRLYGRRLGDLAFEVSEFSTERRLEIVMHRLYSKMLHYSVDDSRLSVSTTNADQFL